MAELKAFRLKGWWKAGVADDTEDVDEEPELKGIYAGLTITPAAKGFPVIKATTAEPPTLVTLCPVEARIDGGQIAMRHDQIDVRLWAKCSALNIGDTPLTYTLKPHDATFNGQKQTGLPTITIVAPTIADDHNDDIDGEIVLDLAECEWLQTAPSIGGGFIIRAVPDHVRKNDAGFVVFSADGTDIAEPLELEITGVPGDFDDLTDASSIGKMVGRALTKEVARAAIDAVSADEVDPLVVDILSADPTPAAAAAAAVATAAGPAIAAAVADKWVTLDVEGDWIAAGMGPLGEFWWGVHADGTYEAAAMSVGGGVTSSVDVDDLRWAASAFSDGTYGEAHEDLNGQLQAWACRNIVARGTAASNITVHVIAQFGQSNGAGRALPTSAEIDPPDPRIFQFGAHATDITVASVPLDMVDTATGISPATLVAREYLKRLPPGDVILIIPAARGGSPLGAADTESANGVWNVAYTGASVNLYSLAKTQTAAALAKAAAKWPGAAIHKVAMLWNQGEGNPDTSQSDYATRLDAIIADYRTFLSTPNLPIVLGGMVPEWVASRGNLGGTQAAHVDTPKRVVRTAYAYAPANSGGNANLDPDNQIHLHREGMEVLSARMLRGLDRALRNVTTSVPNVPQNISATLNGATLTVEWSQPMCRYTAFTLEYSANGGAWTAIPTTTVDTTVVATITGTNPVRVRITVTNEYGTSVTSTPVYAAILKEP